MATLTVDAYRRPLMAADDDLFRRCLTTSATIGVAAAIALMLVPIQQRVITKVEQLPPRFAKLILEPAPKQFVPGPQKLGTPGGGGGGGGRGGLSPAAPATPAPAPALPPAPSPSVRHGVVPALAPTAGVAGRERARQVVSAALGGSAAASLESSLQGLSSSLSAATPVSGGDVAVGRRRVHAVGTGRADTQLGAVRADLGGRSASADLGGSAVGGSLVSIGSLVPSHVGGGSGTGGGTGGGSGGGNGGGFGTGNGDGIGSGSGGGYGSGSGGGQGDGVGRGNGGSPNGVIGGTGSGGAAPPGVYRSNASLMAVIQKYAAGIQFCYGNELKRHEGLRGKLVVALTVSASGEVIDAAIVSSSIDSDRLTSCALSQIKDWKFPAIPAGVTAFQVPFVFTPPN